MKTEADLIIDGLGGSTAVARMMDAPLSTVHSWRKNGIPRSRLAHLKLLARDAKPGFVFPQIAASQQGAAA